MALSPSDEIALSHQFRALLDSETGGLAGPPLGDLVTGSLRRGRRRRRNRMLAQVAAATAAASVMVGAAMTLPRVLLGGTSAIGPAALSSHTAGAPAVGAGSPAPTRSSPVAGAPITPAPPAGSPASAPGDPTSDPTAPDPAASAPRSSDPRASGVTPREGASPAAASQRVLESQAIAALRAAGVRGRATTAVVPETESMIEVNVAGVQGPGMFRISVVRGEPYDPADAEVRVIPDAPHPVITTAPDGMKQATLADGTVARVLPDGSTVTIRRIPGNCIQDQIVSVTHPDGRSVYLGNASCLAWDGATNPPANRPLTTEQAVALAADPSLGA